MSKTAPAPLYRRPAAVAAAVTWFAASAVLILTMDGFQLSPLPAALFVLAATLTIADMINRAVSTRGPAARADIDEVTETFAVMAQPLLMANAPLSTVCVASVPFIAAARVETPTRRAPLWSAPTGETVQTESERVVKAYNVGLQAGMLRAKADGDPA